MTKTKKDIYPKKPTTKRDKHFYDMGALEQAKLFSSISIPSTYTGTFSWDYRENKGYKKAIMITLIVIIAVISLIYAMYGDQQALNNGLIH